jgi:hypothetical protein
MKPAKAGLKTKDAGARAAISPTIDNAMTTGDG